MLRNASLAHLTTRPLRPRSPRRIASISRIARLHDEGREALGDVLAVLVLGVFRQSVILN